MSPLWSLVASAALLAGNGFFVASEFAFVASKAHRLEEGAQKGKVGRAALSASRNLSTTLSGAQLGITLCSLGLGALAEPAVEHLASPVFHSIGIPTDLSHVIAFVLALVLVVFLHMVVGEMAPKSWAITNPERSALILALPFAFFNTIARPLLVVLNAITNAVLRLLRVQSQDELAHVHGPDELRVLLHESKEQGTLAELEHTLLTRMLKVQHATLVSIMVPHPHVVAVPATARDVDIERVSRQSGRSRVIVTDVLGQFCGLVHVREAVRSTTTGAHRSAADMMSTPLTLRYDVSIAEAVELMRQARSQLAIVSNGDVQIGLVAFEDLLEELLGQFDDETDLQLAR